MTNTFLEYARAHLISLMQDLEQIEDEMESLEEGTPEYVELDFEFNHMAGQILSTQHLLKVYGEMISDKEGGKNDGDNN